MHARSTFRAAAPLLAVAMSLAPSPGRGQERPLHGGRLIARIDSLVQADMDRTMTAGMSVAVEYRNEVLMARGYGYADVEHDVRATAETIFPLGSLTTQFTALAVLQLAAEGDIRLDDDITEYLSEYPTQGHEVTIHHLLTHTSGIKDYTSLGPGFQDVSRLDLSHGEILALFAEEPFDFDPGDEARYNNSAYYLLGVLVERVTGRAYGDYVAQRIFGPLGMTSSSYCSNRNIIRHRTRSYSREPGRLVHADYLSMRVVGAAGALCANVLDLLKWQRALDADRLLPPALHDRMFAEATLNDGSATGYAYGTRITDIDGHRMIGQGGGTFGFATALVGFPDDGLTVAVLANTAEAPAGAVAVNIARLVLDLPLQPAELVTEPAPSEPPADDSAQRESGGYQEHVDLPPGWRSRYPGTYGVGEREVHVYAEGDELKVEVPGQIDTRLLYLGEGVFAMEAGQRVTVEFEHDGERVTAVVFVTGEQRMRGERLTQPTEELPARDDQLDEAAPPHDLELPSGWRERYPGTYTMGERQLRVYAEDDSLMLSVPDQVTARLHYQGDDVFVMAIGRQLPVEFEVSGSRATAVVVVTPNGRMRGERGGD